MLVLAFSPALVVSGAIPIEPGANRLLKRQRKSSVQRCYIERFWYLLLHLLQLLNSSLKFLSLLYTPFEVDKPRAGVEYLVHHHGVAPLYVPGEHILSEVLQ